ncbi:MAG: hypothetical protein L0Y66_09685, partial [Myxococcaceae bacterium]|nr:hypothetical protein [Myxococcaceae bacterium]
MRSVRWTLPTGAAALMLSLTAGAGERTGPSEGPVDTVVIELIQDTPPGQDSPPQGAEAMSPPGAEETEVGRPRSGTGRVDCYARADALVGLADENAFRLCDASDSDAPVQCYELAREEGLLDDYQSVLLCAYATDVGPAECFLAAKERTFLSEHDIIR